MANDVELCDVVDVEVDVKLGFEVRCLVGAGQHQM